MGDRSAAERRLRALRGPVVAVRAECGLGPGQPPVMGDDALARIRACVPHLVEHTLADTTHYTLILADPGATMVADLLADFARHCGA